MAAHKAYSRPVEAIMASTTVRVCDEASIRWPYPKTKFYKLIKEGRLEVDGSPAIVRAEHFDEQERAGFPVIRQQDHAA
jgi:hypothetical protein